MTNIFCQPQFLSSRRTLTNVFMEWIMFKFNRKWSVQVMLLSMSVMLKATLVSVQADDQPTQEHQTISQMDFTPAKNGTRFSGQPLVHVKINGIADATFLVDTGASSSFIDTSTAKRLGLRLQRAVSDNGQPITLNGRQEQATMTQITLFAIGHIQVNNATFLVLPDSNLQAGSGSVYDGVIGANMLAGSAILLDSPQHKFGFCLPGALSPQQLGQIGLAHPYVLPITTSGGKWFAQAELTKGSSTNDADLLVDTGSNTTGISTVLAEKLHLNATDLGVQHDVYTTKVVGMGQVDILHLGDLTLRDVPITVRAASESLPSLLGMDILSSYRVLIDFPAKKMYLQSNTAAAVPAITIGPALATTAPPAK